MKRNDISDLLARYEQVITTGKNIYFDADEYDDIAEYYEKSDNLDIAREVVNLGLEIHPGNEALMLRYARFLVYDGNYTASLQYLNTHFTTYDFEISILKIECLLQLGLYAEAHALTAEVLEDNETEVDVILSELGFLYIEAEYLDEAILYFEKSLEYNSENVDVLSDLIYAYESKEDFLAAISTCERLLDVDPYGLEGWLMLGKLYSLIEEYDKAIDAFDFALTLDDLNLNILKLKAHCLILSERIEEAIEILNQCIEVDPEDKVSYIAIAECFADLDRYNKVLEIVSVYDSKFGESIDSIVAKVYALLYREEMIEAKWIIDNSLSEYPDSYSLHVVAGDVYAKSNKISEAKMFYEEALSLKSDEDNESVLEKLVSFYIKNNDLVSAIKYQKMLIENIGTQASQEKLALLYIEAEDKIAFMSYVESLSDDVFYSFFKIFYPDETFQSESDQERSVILKRFSDIYDSRILYKNIKY